jgi:hypothetical protein
MTDELHKEFTVESCVRCPMNYDSMCDHPSLGPERIDVDERDDGLSAHDSPHPRCPLREMPLLLRVKP